MMRGRERRAQKLETRWVGLMWLIRDVSYAVFEVEDLMQTNK